MIINSHLNYVYALFCKIEQKGYVKHFAINYSKKHWIKKKILSFSKDFLKNIYI